MARTEVAEQREKGESGRDVCMREEVAHLLKHARTEKGLSLKEAAASTRVPAQYLQILEGEGNPHVLSDALYLVPFLRSYANFLGLDPAITVAQFVSTIPPIPVAEEPSQTKISGLSSWTFVIFMIIVGLAVLSFFWLNGNYQQIFRQ